MDIGQEFFIIFFGFGIFPGYLVFHCEMVQKSPDEQIFALYLLQMHFSKDFLRVNRHLIIIIVNL